MKVTVEKGSNTRRSVQVVFPWDELEEEYEAGLVDVRKEFQMPGFRKGKVPMPIVRKQFSKSVLADLLDQKIRDNYTKIVEDNNLKVLDVLAMKPEKVEVGFDCEFSLEFEVEPDFDLWDYKQGFEIEKTEYIIDDSDVDRSIEDLRERNSEKKIVEGGAEEGHFLLADLQEVDSTGVSIIGKKADKRLIKLGEGYFSGEVLEILKGIKAGETRRISIKEGDENYYFDVKCLVVEEHILPELNDEFAQKVDPEAKNVEELRESVKQSIDRQLRNSAESDFENHIVEFLVNKHDIEVPESLIEKYYQNIIEEEKARGNSSVDEEYIRQNYRDRAVFAAKWYLISSGIMENENLSVSEDEIQEYIEHEVSHAKENLKKFYRDFYNSEKQKNRIREELENNKLLEHIKQFVKVKMKKVKTKDLLVGE